MATPMALAETIVDGLLLELYDAVGEVSEARRTALIQLVARKIAEALASPPVFPPDCTDNVEKVTHVVGPALERARRGGFEPTAVEQAQGLVMCAADIYVASLARSAESRQQKTDGFLILAEKALRSAYDAAPPAIALVGAGANRR